MRESTLVNNIRKMLAAKGCWTMKVHGTPATRGKPDILACCRGRFVALEAKVGHSYGLTDLQKYELESIEKAGGIAACVRTVQEAENVIRGIFEEQIREHADPGNAV